MHDAGTHSSTIFQGKSCWVEIRTQVHVLQIKKGPFFMAVTADTGNHLKQISVVPL